MTELFSVNVAPLLAFCWFAWVGAVTPGPNTLLALAIAVNFGARSVRSHMIGVVIGTGLLMAAALTGMYSLLAAAPTVALGLKWLGVAWLVWLGVGLMRARQEGQRSMARPPRVYESALLQLANGKGWMLVTATAATWRGVATPAWVDVPLLTAVYVANCALALGVWAVVGRGMSEWLRVGRRTARFNAAMGASLIATALWMAVQ
jgi:threonine/homoserine/homoserine lactone efflux protein